MAAFGKTDKILHKKESKKMLTGSHKRDQFLSSSVWIELLILSIR